HNDADVALAYALYLMHTLSINKDEVAKKAVNTIYGKPIEYSVVDTSKFSMLGCKVCNLKFIPTYDRHYIAKATQLGNILMQEKEILYDAYDCPICGSQIIATERYPEL